MPNFIALDIALIPDEDHFVKLEKWNKSLFENGKTGYLFNDNHIPHLTLFQNFILEEQLDNLKKDLLDLPTPKEICELLPVDFSRNAHKDDISVVMLNFVKSLELLNTQKRIHHIFEKYSKHPYLEDALSAFNNKTNPEAASWIQNFATKASLDKYSPHITLGFSNLDISSLKKWQALPNKWRFSKIVLSQMGNYCSLSKNTYWEKRLG